MARADLADGFMNNRSDSHDRPAACPKEARKARGRGFPAAARLSDLGRAMVRRVEDGDPIPASRPSGT